MDATLRYAKVVDSQRYRLAAGRIRDLESGVELTGQPPAPAAEFVVVRAWDRTDGAFTETWRIVDPNGRTVRDPVDREYVDTDEAADFVGDQAFDYADGGYEVVFDVDGLEAARADFPVRAPEG
ncbi:MAG: hypothetical protein M3N17_10340 [Actinomycetota bacterium]|nr:hypothetical protein [Actinomycetota bacterium]